MVSISYMCSRQNYIELTDNKISILDVKKISHLKLSYFVLKIRTSANNVYKRYAEAYFLSS